MGQGASRFVTFLVDGIGRAAETGYGKAAFRGGAVRAFPVKVATDYHGSDKTGRKRQRGKASGAESVGLGDPSDGRLPAVAGVAVQPAHQPGPRGRLGGGGLGGLGRRAAGGRGVAGGGGHAELPGTMPDGLCGGSGAGGAAARSGGVELRGAGAVGGAAAAGGGGLGAAAAERGVYRLPGGDAGGGPSELPADAPKPGGDVDRHVLRGRNLEPRTWRRPVLVPVNPFAR